MVRGQNCQCMEVRVRVSGDAESFVGAWRRVQCRIQSILVATDRSGDDLHNGSVHELNGGSQM